MFRLDVLVGANTPLATEQREDVEGRGRVFEVVAPSIEKAIEQVREELDTEDVVVLFPIKEEGFFCLRKEALYDSRV